MIACSKFTVVCRFVLQEYLKPVLQSDNKETVNTARNTLYPPNFIHTFVPFTYLHVLSVSLFRLSVAIKTTVSCTAEQTKKYVFVTFLNLSKLHVSGEWFNSSQSIHAFRDRGAISTIAAKDWELSTKYLCHTLPRGGKWRARGGEGKYCFKCEMFKSWICHHSDGLGSGLEGGLKFTKIKSITFILHQFSFPAYFLKLNFLSEW